MVVSVIYKYLERNKRLVVPNLGAFIVKVAGEKVLFSNLIKGDDGVLRGLLVENGLTELEAAAAIDRFVFEVNSRLEESGVCELHGLGKLSKGVNGTLQFAFDPATSGSVLDGGAAEYVATKSAESEKIESTVEIVPAEEEEEEVEIVVEPLVEPEEPAKTHQEPQQPPHGEEVDIEEERLMQYDSRAVGVNVDDHKPRTVSTVTQPADYVKGLRYGKGRKDLSGRDYALKRKKTTVDLIMQIAIGAAVLATLALAYGLFNDWRNGNFGGGYEPEYEEIVEEPQSQPEGEIRNPDLDYITPKK